MEKLDYVELWMSKVCESSRTRHGYSGAWKKFEEFCYGKGYDIKNIVPDWRSIKSSSRNRDQKIERFKDEIKDLIDAYRSYITTLDWSTTTIKTYLSVVKSFMSSSGIPVDVDIPKRAFGRYHNRDITKEEIRSIVEHVHSLRDKVFFIMMAESGMRPDTLCKLQYKHIKQDYEKNRIPMKVELPSELLKYRVSDRFTFVGEDSLRLLKEYLRLFKMADEDYVFKPRRKGTGDQHMEGQSTPQAFSLSFNRTIQTLKLSEIKGKGKPKALRLYSLRKYFRNNLRSVDSGFINFWMGHTDNADMHYLSTDLEEHRRRYTEGYQHLRIYEKSESVQMKDLENKLTEANKTIEKLQQNSQHKEQTIQSLTKSMTLLGTRVKLMEECWKDIEAIRNAKVVKNPDGSVELKAEETET